MLSSDDSDNYDTKIFIRFSKTIDRTDFITDWEMGYDYIGVCYGETAPTDKTDYTWSKFYNYIEPMENFYIKYSQYADGTEFVSAWEKGYNYIGVAKAETEPTSKTGYVWTSVNKTEVINNFYIAYSAQSDGTDYKTEYFDGCYYIGLCYTDISPTDKSAYTWSQFKQLPPAKPTEIKILAIGNSFSDDATEYLWKVYNNAGYTKVVIGNLYIGGCSLDTHWANMQANNGAYDYRKNVADDIVTTSCTSILTALNQEQWDIVTIQQSSGVSGDQSSYRNLQNVINYIKTNEPSAKIYWHMTWAYQGNSTHADFYRYFNDQRTMYNSIVDTVKRVILTNPDIAGVIPSGTTIQNLRNSELGDTLTRDGYHLSYDLGRYATSLTWLRTIYNDNIDSIDTLPNDSAYASNVIKYLDLLKEAVNKAHENPFEMTPCDYLHKTDTLTMTESDKTLLQNNGYDPDKFYKIDLE